MGRDRRILAQTGLESNRGQQGSCLCMDSDTVRYWDMTKKSSHGSAPEGKMRLLLVALVTASQLSSMDVIAKSTTDDVKGRPWDGQEGHADSDDPALLQGRGLRMLGGLDSMSCGGLPSEWLPSPERAEQRRRLFQAWDPAEGEDLLEGWNQTEIIVSDPQPLPRRRLLKGYGSTKMGAGCGKAKQYNVPHEHDGAGLPVKKNVKAAEKPLADCLKDIRRCNNQAMDIARRLPGIRLLLSKRGKFKVKGLQERYGTCALVGNAGHLSKREYGKYIDRHDAVVRFNVQPTAQFLSHVGSKTLLRVVNHRRSLALCCRGNWPEAKAGDTSSGVMIWFPAAQSEILGECQKRYPSNPRMSLDSSIINVEVQAMSLMRKDLQRLGWGPLGEWRQMTSGSHALMLFATLCDTVSLFGFTTYGSQSAGGADHYSAAILKQQGVTNTKLGATVKARSGEKWHDWKGEKLAIRLLHAAGLVNICSQ